MAAATSTPIVAGAAPRLPAELEAVARLLDGPRPLLVVVVGSGVSYGATGDPRATWKGLLLHGIEEVRRQGLAPPATLDAERTLVEDAFAGPGELAEILRRAESVVRRLGGVDDPRFATWLADAIGTLRASEDRRDTLAALAEVARAGGLILTTNYDDLLEEATGLEPVTWDEPEALNAVINRQRPGIIHLHGHWRRPASVVFGTASYAALVGTDFAQLELKNLWLHWHWMYVGCGPGGMTDPNVGALLEWGARLPLPKGPLPHYFLADSATVEALPTPLRASTHLVTCLYPAHEALPGWLRALAPAARCAPFQLVGPDARRVRHPTESPLDSPFPSWDEYLAAAVPGLAAEEEVRGRLENQGWALVFDVASVGKSTLAFRIAARPEFRGRTYHLLLSESLHDDPLAGPSPQAAIARLARPGNLLVVDDAHQQPELAHTLWQLWNEDRNGSYLLVLATRTQRLVNPPGASSLAHLAGNPTNPPIPIRATPADLWAIAAAVLTRAGVRTPGVPPDDALARWHEVYGREIGAFVYAVSFRRHALAGGDWALPAAAAAGWVEERHLRSLRPLELENAVTLAALAERNLELDVPEPALPHALQVAGLLRSGLAERRWVGDGRHVRYGLREPGWGGLILAALGREGDCRSLVADAAARDVNLANITAARLARAPGLHDVAGLLEDLDARREPVLASLAIAPLATCALFLKLAHQHGHRDLVDQGWAAVSARSDGLAALARTTSLVEVRTFLLAAESQGRHPLASQLWTDLAASPNALADWALRYPIDGIVLLVETARQLGRRGFVEGAWSALHDRADALATCARGSSLSQLCLFFRTATEHGQHGLADRIWASLADDSESLTARAIERPEQAPAFLDLADRTGHRSVADGVRMGLAAGPTWISEVTHEDASPRKRAGQKALAAAMLPTLVHDTARLDAVVAAASFTGLAMLAESTLRSGDAPTAHALWAAMTRQPEGMVAKALAVSPTSLRSFLTIAERAGQEQLVGVLWRALEDRPGAMLDRATARSVGPLFLFVDWVSGSHRGPFVRGFWAACATQVEGVARLVAGAPLTGIHSFFRTVRANRQDALAREAWRALAERPAALAERVYEGNPTELAEVLGWAAQDGHVALCDGLWDAIEARPERFLVHATTLAPGPFRDILDLLQRSGRKELVDQVLLELIADAPRLAGLALGYSLNDLSVLVKFAEEPGREAFRRALWALLEREENRVAGMAQGGAANGFGAFLTAAAGGDFARRVCETLARDPDEFTRAALLDGPNALSALLVALEQTGEGTLLDLLWHRLAAEPTRLIASETGSSLNDWAAFLRTAAAQGRTAVAAEIWATLLADPTRLVGAETSLNDLLAFVTVASEQHLDAHVQVLCARLASQGGLLRELVRASSVGELGAFLRRLERLGDRTLRAAMLDACDQEVGAVAANADSQPAAALMVLLVGLDEDRKSALISRLELSHWEPGPYRNARASTGVPGLAAQFYAHERADLARALVVGLLQRRNPGDFGDGASALLEFGRLLSQAEPGDREPVDALVATVVTDRWLDLAYRLGSHFGVATGLHYLAMCQPASVIARFQHRTLERKLQGALTPRGLADTKGLSAAIQLLGSASLLGLRVPPTVLEALPWPELGALPQGLRRPEDVVWMERVPRQIWLGMRVVASVRRRPVQVAPACLAEAVTLWRANIHGGGRSEGTIIRPDGTPHRVNVSMVAWLEACLATGNGRLVSDPVPLWRLTGLP